ncbi:hypothetical protein [Nostoc sp. CCY 9925]|uniref:hypothetical protein n=1 Tax=Nostoc sp. CCY 9925 TaxID=3103865 RepID=UPI0039C72C4E
MSSLIFFGIVRSRRLINPKISHLQHIGECDTPKRVQGERIPNQVGYAIAFLSHAEEEEKGDRCF